MSSDHSYTDYSRPKMSYKSWPIDDDIVISGIGGRFPESENFDQLAANLLNSVDMITRDDRRWPVGLNANEASRSGKIKDLALFDSTYFCTLPIIADHMEPGSRIILETTYEAIADAGIAPQQIRGSRTGVYCGINTVACAEALPQDDFSDIRAKDAAFWVYGNSKALLANRISFLFDFIGPSTVIDTACSSSLVAMCSAVQDMRMGICDSAIVATSNLCLAPYSSYVFSSLGLLAHDGKCKVFDKSADGFVRSETVSCIFLQRRSLAKRVYATVMHAKTNTDGFKTIGLFAPFWLRQRNLMVETFQEAGVDPHQIKYFESHGTGTNVGDPQEAKAVSEAYCTNRKDKLLVGAVKSNLGHTEGASGICSVAKGIIILETGIIPANLHYSEPKDEIECLHKTIEPVVVNTPFPGEIVGVNSFGVGGVNAHCLLKMNSKEPNDSMLMIADPIPRLVNVCGRTEEAIEHIFEFIEKNPKRAHCDFFALLNDAMKTAPIRGSGNFPHRGYMLIQKTANWSYSEPTYEYSRIIELTKKSEPVWLIFSGMGSQWTGMGKELMKVKIFRRSVEASAQVLKPYQIDLLRLIQSDDDSVWLEQVVYPFVAITAMQIGLYDIVSQLELPIAGLIGHSFGEIACAYADGCISAEQAILTSYWRGKTVQETQGLPKGIMAAVGLTWEAAEKYCTEGVYLACHNGHDSVTVSGLYAPMVNFIESLQLENIFVRRVAGGEYPYHSVVMNQVAPKLLEKLKTVIRTPKRRSTKWVSTSVPSGREEEDSALFASGDYFVNNLQNPVFFEEGMRLIPKKAICIEMAPHSLFDSIFKRCYKDLSYISLMKKTESNNLVYFLSALGKVYTYGLNPAIESLYPKVHWPVARGTQSIGSLLKWDHSKEHSVKLYPDYHNFGSASNYLLTVTLLDSDWRFLRDHAVDGRIVFPATGYLMIAWRALATRVGQPWHKVPVHFENIRICRPTLLNETSVAKFSVQIIEKSGDFIVSEGSSVVCTGKVTCPETGDEFLEFQGELGNSDSEWTIVNSENEHVLNNKEIYKELRIRGYDYGSSFQGLVEASGDGTRGTVQWTGHWISYVDSALHLSLLSLPIRTLFVPVAIDSFKCDPRLLFDAINKTKENVAKDTSVDMNKKHLQSEFCYFKDMAENQEILAPENTEEMTEIAKKDATMPFEIMNFSFENTVENEKKVFFGVTFDFANQTLVTKGIEVKGLVPVNIPRLFDNQGLMLEQYRFVPFNDEARFEVDGDGNKLDIYIDTASKLLAQVLGKYQLDNKFGHLEDGPVADVERYTGISEKPYRYVQTLKSILDGAELTKYIENESDLRRYLTEQIPIWQEDVLNDATFLGESFTRPTMELIAENCQHLGCLKVLEICPNAHLLSSSICEMLKLNVIHKFEVDYTATRHEALIMPSDETIKLKTIEWNRKDASFLDSTFSEFNLIVLRRTVDTDALWNEEAISKMVLALKPGGFILVISRSTLTPFEVALDKLLQGKLKREMIVENEDALNEVLTGNSQFLPVSSRRENVTGIKMLLFRKEAFLLEEVAPHIQALTIDVNGSLDAWVEPLKAKVMEIANNENVHGRLWIISHCPISGILGFANCLRLESPYGSKVRILFVAHSDWNNNATAGDDIRALNGDTFDLANPLVADLVLKDLAFNVYLDGNWGSYRFLPLAEEQQIVSTTQAYLSQKQRGDLSSLQWFESEHKCFGDLPPKFADSKELICNVYYSALNFKDVVIASGKIVPGPESALFDCVIGLEFSGRRQDNGERVMGMVPFKGIATAVLTHQDFVWAVPQEWSLEEAASVPVIYITAYYALIMRGQLKQGDSVLIHSGTGGVGQAAINICQSLGCEIFASVGTEEKRKFLKDKYGFDETHIVNSRDTAFERHIKTITKGRGVDVVLNSLTGDKLQASLRCLSPNGRFLEIGKYDMQMNTSLGMFAFLNNITFHGVGLDCFFREGLTSKKLTSFINEVTGLITEGIKEGVVKPLNRVVFQRTQVEKAFRHMTTGKHIGKVIICIREEECPRVASVLKPEPVVVEALCRTWFNPHKVFLIAGGLGGVGLELLYWMVLQGARKFVLTSRSGLKSTFQRVFLERFRVIEDFCEEYKIEVVLSQENIAIPSQCQSLLEQARKMGPIGGVFNLTLVLEDGLFEKQTADKFKKVIAPKFDGLVNLDLLTRQMKLDLEYFVAFSSFSAGRGNAGQTNYGYANSAMERVIEQRIRDGLNGIAVQYGPINDVGIVAEHMLAHDDGGNEDAMKLLMGLEMQRIYSCLEVLNRILPLKTGIYSSYVKFANNVLKGGSDDEVIRQLCIHLNIDKRPEDECLGDIGLDSLAAVEIQQRLERDFNISLTLADVRKITVKELKNFRDGNRHNLKQYSDDIKKAKANLSRIRFVIPNSELTPLNSITEGKPFYCLPPLKGVFDLVSMLVQKCKRPVIGLNWTRHLNSFKTLKAIVKYYHDLLLRLDAGGDGTYDLMCTSFGALIISVMARSKRMSATLKVGKLIIFDLLPINLDGMTDESQLANYKVNLMFNYIRLYIPERICEQSMKEILELNCEKERVEKTTELMRKCVGNNLQGADMAEIIGNSYERASLMLKYHFEMRRKSKSAVRRILVEVMHQNEQIFLEYIKLIDKEDHIKGYERKLKSIFDVDTFEEQFSDRYRMHLVQGSQEDLILKQDGQIQELLNDITKL